MEREEWEENCNEKNLEKDSYLKRKNCFARMYLQTKNSRKILRYPVDKSVKSLQVNS